MLADSILRKTKFISQSNSLRNIVVLFSGKAGVLLISLLSQPILARLYTPAQFGEFAFLNGLLAILLIGASGRYEEGIVITRKPFHAKRLFQLAQTILLFYVCLVIILLWIIPKSGVLNFDSFIPSFYLWLLPVFILCSGYWQIVEKWHIRFRQFSKVSVGLFTQRLIILFFSITAWHLSASFNGLILGLLCGYISIFLLAIYHQRQPLRLPIRVARNYAASFHDFPLYSTPVTLIILFCQYFPIMWLTYFNSTTEAGFFNMAITFIIIPANLLSISVGPVFFQRLAQSSFVQRVGIIKKTTLFYALLLTIPVAVALIFGEKLVILFLGDQWQPAGRILTLLAPLIICQGLSNCLMISFSVYRKQAFSLILHFIKLILWTLALWIGLRENDLFLSCKLISGFSIFHLLLITLLLAHTIRRARKNSRGTKKLSRNKSLVKPVL